MSVQSWIYYFKEAFGSIRRNIWMSFASTGVVTVTLLIFGTFLLTATNLAVMTKNLETTVEISVFLDKEIKDDDRVLLGRELAATKHVESARFVSKEEGLKQLQREMGWEDEDLEVLGANPLPDAYYVRVDSPANVDLLARTITRMEGVETVRYGKDIVEKLFRLTQALRYTGIVLIVLLAFAAVFIIANTIKLTVVARRKEISIMKSVGATNWFIRWPFALEGLILGLVGSLIATGVLFWGYQWVQVKVSELLPFIVLVKDANLLGMNYWTVISLGCLLGLVGSAVSIRRYLKV